jgi:protein-S-isoprenylcysteine O-methyltransferase Ste14
MKDRFLRQAKHEYSARQRLLAFIPEAVLFIGVLPVALVWAGGGLDRALQWPRLFSSPINLLIGILFIALGWPFALWSIYAQFTRGRGTPVPLMATQKLVVEPPYTYCRNPMAGGAVLAYLGVSVLAGSPGAALLAILGGMLLFTYIKQVEEKEMELRFGAEYLEYRRRTPFVIPRFEKKGDHSG